VDLQDPGSGGPFLPSDLEIRSAIEVEVQRFSGDCDQLTRPPQPFFAFIPFAVPFDRACDRWFTFVVDSVSEDSAVLSERVIGVSSEGGLASSIVWYDSAGMTPFISQTIIPGGVNERAEFLRVVPVNFGLIEIETARFSIPLSALEKSGGPGGTVPGELDCADLRDVFPNGRPTGILANGSITPLGLVRSTALLDVDGSEQIDAGDYDLLCEAIRLLHGPCGQNRTACPDADGDGDVDSDDNVLVLSQFGETGCFLAGDVDGDGDVDIDDLLLVLGSIGATCP